MTVTVASLDSNGVDQPFAPQIKSNVLHMHTTNIDKKKRRHTQNTTFLKTQQHHNKQKSIRLQKVIVWSTKVIIGGVVAQRVVKVGDHVKV